MLTLQRAALGSLRESCCEMSVLQRSDIDGMDAVTNTWMYAPGAKS
jgi:hypothetical protein